MKTNWLKIMTNKMEKVTSIGGLDHPPLFCSCSTCGDGSRPAVKRRFYFVEFFEYERRDLQLSKKCAIILS